MVTECWLREAAFYISPTRPDYISTRGLAFLRKFRQRNPEMGFAELLGVIVNMKDPQSSDDEQYDRWLRQNGENRCFKQSILRVTPLQSAAYYSPSPRSYWAKYPGQTGDHAAPADRRAAAARGGGAGGVGGLPLPACGERAGVRGSGTLRRRCANDRWISSRAEFGGMSAGVLE